MRPDQLDDEYAVAWREKQKREEIEFLWKEMQHREKGKRMIKTLLLWLGIVAFVVWLVWWLQGVSW